VTAKPKLTGNARYLLPHPCIGKALQGDAVLTFCTWAYAKSYYWLPCNQNIDTVLAIPYFTKM